MPRSTRKRFRQRDGIQSQQEFDFKARYPQLAFKPSAIAYQMPVQRYNPDFLLGETTAGFTVYVELKEYLTDKDCPKLEAIVNSNSRAIICVLILSAASSVFTRLAKHPRIFPAQGYTDIPDAWERLVDGRGGHDDG